MTKLYVIIAFVRHQHLRLVGSVIVTLLERALQPLFQWQQPLQLAGQQQLEALLLAQSPQLAVLLLRLSISWRISPLGHSEQRFQSDLLRTPRAFSSLLMIVHQLLLLLQPAYFGLFVLKVWRLLISEKLVVVCLFMAELIVVQLATPALGSSSPVHHVSEQLHAGFPRPSL